MFVHREAELQQLGDWFSKPRAPIALVWGRRRVGKTALLQAFSASRRTVFHTGAGRPRDAELRAFSRAVQQAASHQVRDLVARPFTDWDDAVEYLQSASTTEPLLVVMDEFPEVERSAPELPGILRAALDRPESSGLRIVLCGSAVRSMNALGDTRQPLHGRFGVRVQVHPFMPWEAATLLPGLPPADQALVYAIVGGMPLYLSWWDTERSVEDNLNALLLRPGAPLITEGHLVLATEVDDGTLPEQTLRAIARGATRYGEIKNAVKAEPQRVLARLAELKLVEQNAPVTENSSTGRTSRYRIVDPFLSFSLGTLSTFAGEIDRGLGAGILPTLVDALNDHCGPVFEAMMRDWLRHVVAGGELVDAPVAVGSWWNTGSDTEIDAVVLTGRSRTPALVAECRWTCDLDVGRAHRVLYTKAQQLGVDPEQVAYLAVGTSRLGHVPPGILTATAAHVMSGAAPDTSAHEMLG